MYVEIIKRGASLSRARLDVDARGRARTRVTFGRAETNDIALDHASCSREHACVRFNEQGDDAVVVDLNSAHGTFVNGARVASGTFVSIRDGDHISFGESSRTYVVMECEDANEVEVDDEKMSEEEVRALNALERAAEAEVASELEALKAERARNNERNARNAASWGMDDADDAIAERQRAVEEVDWRSREGALSDKQEKQRENIRRKEEKVGNMRQEMDRIRAKEATQEGGLTAGQATRLTAVASAIEALEEEIEDMDETLNESLRVSLGIGTVVSKRRRRHGSDGDDSSGGEGEDDFFDRSGATAQRKLKKEMRKSQNAKTGASAAKTFETATTLWDKRIALDKSIADIEELISITEAAAQAERARMMGVSADGDALDAYMDEIGASRFTSKVDKLRITLSEKVSELERVSRLLKLADPTEEFKPGSAKGDALRRRAEEERVKADEDARRRTDELQAMRANELETRRKRAEEAKRQEEWERQGNVQEKRKFTGGAEPQPSRVEKPKAVEADEGPVVVQDVDEHRRGDIEIPFKPQPERVRTSPPRASPPRALNAEDDDDGFLLPHQLAARGGGLEIRKRPPMAAPPPRLARKAPPAMSDMSESSVLSDIQRLIDASAGAGRDIDDDVDNETAGARTMWVPPPEQTGDGKSSLNAKLGY